MIDHSGNIINLPYIGCYSGCAQDYCYLFGVEVPWGIYSGVTILGTLILVAMGLYLLAKFRHKKRHKKWRKKNGAR